MFVSKDISDKVAAGNSIQFKNDLVLAMFAIALLERNKG